MSIIYRVQNIYLPLQCLYNTIPPQRLIRSELTWCHIYDNYTHVIVISCLCYVLKYSIIRRSMYFAWFEHKIQYRFYKYIYIRLCLRYLTNTIDGGNCQKNTRIYEKGHIYFGQKIIILILFNFSLNYIFRQYGSPFIC